MKCILQYSINNEEKLKVTNRLNTAKNAVNDTACFLNTVCILVIFRVLER